MVKKKSIFIHSSLKRFCCLGKSIHVTDDAFKMAQYPSVQSSMATAVTSSYKDVNVCLLDRFDECDT